MTHCSAVLAALLLSLFARPLAAFDGIRLTLLGGGVQQSAQDGPVGPGILVEAGDELLLFDCGVGSSRTAQRTTPASRADGKYPDSASIPHTSAVAPSC